MLTTKCLTQNIYEMGLSRRAAGLFVRLDDTGKTGNFFVGGVCVCGANLISI